MIPPRPPITLRDIALYLVCHLRERLAAVRS